MQSQPASHAGSDQLEERPCVDFLNAMLNRAMYDMEALLSHTPQHSSDFTAPPHASSREETVWNALHSVWKSFVKQKDEKDRTWEQLTEVAENNGFRQELRSAFSRSVDGEQRLLNEIRTLLKTNAADLPFECAEKLLVNFDQIILWKTLLADMMFGDCDLLDIRKDSTRDMAVTEFRFPADDWSDKVTDSLGSITFNTEPLPTFSSMVSFRNFCQASEIDAGEALKDLVNKNFESV